MAEVGSAFVSIIPSAKGFGSKLDREVGGDVEKSGKTSGKRFGAALKGGAIAVLGAAAVGAKFLGDSLGEARESQKVTALTNSVIKATGGAANVTAKQVGNLAGALSNKTGIDDEVIQSGQNMLLTFKNVRNEAGKGNKIFDQASRSLVDMSSAMGTEPRQAAIQLGKALNDPIKGVSALSRVGVTFTDKQKKTIKSLVESGKTMQAQKIILKELNSEFGGAAAAQATASDKARVAFGNLQETVGTALLPVVDRLANIFTTKVAPAITSFVTGMQNGTGAGGRFVAVLGTVGGVISSVFGFIVANKEAVGAFAGVLLAVAAAVRIWAIAQAILNVALTANPIGIVVVAIAAFVAGLVLAYKHSQTFRTIVQAAFRAAGTGARALGAIGRWLWNNAFQPTFQFILSGISKIIGAFAKVIGVIAKIPGPQQAAMRKVASALDGAARHVDDLSGKLRKIPDGKAKVSVDTAGARAEVDGFIRLMSGRTIRIGTHIGGMAGARAAGGPVAARKTYLVGENGPELFTSKQSGNITPNNKLGVAGGGSSVGVAGGPMVLNVYDVDDQLIGSMTAVADSRYYANTALGG